MQGKRTDSGYFTDLLAGVAAVYENRAEGIYITLNPVQPALLARGSNRVREYAIWQGTPYSALPGTSAILRCSSRRWPKLLRSPACHYPQERTLVHQATA
ncbi:MAG: hypothetical protein IT323_03795 [Anaerolineae bacterium]|nr:hypothetical protein [Anaerolineae bacterium]